MEGQNGIISRIIAIDEIPLGCEPLAKQSNKSEREPAEEVGV